MILLLLPLIGVLALINQGNVLIVHTTFSVQQSVDLYHRWTPQPEEVLLQKASRLFELAARLAPSDPTVQWGHGRVALATGRVTHAAALLSADASVLRQNPPRYLDTILAYSRAGADDQVIALYEQIPPPEANEVISDTVALAYLHRARTGLQVGLYGCIARGSEPGNGP